MIAYTCIDFLTGEDRSIVDAGKCAIVASDIEKEEIHDSYLVSRISYLVYKKKGE